MHPKAIHFWSKVAIGGEDECWLWQASTAGPGYGVFWDGERKVYAHRYAHDITNPDNPLGSRKGRHTCDTMLCCNPRHIEPGTQADNIRDRDERGRTARGVRGGRSKLDDSKVRSIRSRYALGGITQKELAVEYAVTAATVQAVLEGRTWRHVRKRLVRTR